MLLRMSVCLSAIQTHPYGSLLFYSWEGRVRERGSCGEIIVPLEWVLISVGYVETFLRQCGREEEAMHTACIEQSALQTACVEQSTLQTWPGQAGAGGC